MTADEQQQMIDLQTQLAFQEDLLTALDIRVTEQDAEIRLLRQQLQQLARMSRQMRDAMEERGISEPGLAAQMGRPPHY